MTTKIDDGGLAFPGFRNEQVGTVADFGFKDDDNSPTFGDVQHPGMTLRDWFAGQVLSNMDFRGETPARAADWSYSVADAMLAHRKGAA